jgi:hypothetical protein
MKQIDEMDELTPRAIVRELDKYIVGQKDAKKVVAIALRNRMRRRQLEEALQEEVVPKNIIMIGPTGVGKTEIARRLARLVQAPFVKVEATKYTEVGYVGRDVESMVRDLVETAVTIGGPGSGCWTCSRRSPAGAVLSAGMADSRKSSWKAMRKGRSFLQKHPTSNWPSCSTAARWRNARLSLK